MISEPSVVPVCENSPETRAVNSISEQESALLQQHIAVFFASILPDQGVYFVASVDTNGWKHYPCATFNEMTTKVLQLGRRESDVYFACASYVAKSYIDKSGTRRRRTKENAGWAKSFWIDVDCGQAKAEAGQGYATLQEASQAVLAFVTATGLPKPTVVVSGGGLHCYWPLTNTIAKDEWMAVAERLQYLMASADHVLLVDTSRTADVASVLRPPGTHNWKPGRDGAEVTLLRTGPAIPFEQFRTLIDAAARRAFGEPENSLAGALDDLPSNLFDQAHPEDFSAERIIAGCQQFAWAKENQADVPEPIWRAMVGTLSRTDKPEIIHQFSDQHHTYTAAETEAKAKGWPGGGVMCATLERMRPAGCEGCPHRGKIRAPSALGTKSAARTVTLTGDWMGQALPEDQHLFKSDADAVAYLNQRIAYLPQENMILDRALADDEGDPFRYVRVRDARDIFANTRVVVGSDEKTTVRPAFDVWMKSPHRREYRKVVFDASGDPLPPRTLNLWGGFGVQPKKGDCSLIRKHMREVICSGNIDQSHYLIKLLAWKVKHPHLPTEIALVLRTDEEGAGKDTLFEILRKMFGSHYRVAANPDHLFKWNAGLLSNAAVVSINEMLWSGNHQHAGRFKEMITAKKIGTEAKFASPGNTTNSALYLLSSNEDWVVPAGKDARRFFVPDVSSARVADTVYFDALYAEINGDGPAALLYDLLELVGELGNWHPRHGVPQTGALKEQKLQSLDPVGRWWQDCLDDGEVAFDSRVGRQTIISVADWSAGPVIASKDRMVQAFLDWASRRRIVERKGITTAELFRQLRRYAPGGTARVPGVGTRIGAQFADHATCVVDFEAALKRK